jgi:hypothetical protein
VAKTLCNSTVSMSEEVSDYVRENDTDTFDVSRPERDIKLDLLESDILDDTTVEILSISELTYQVIAKGTETGKPNTLDATFLIQISSKLVRKIVFMISR